MGKIQAGLEIQAGVQGLDEIKKLLAEIEAAGTDTGRLAEQRMMFGFLFRGL